MRSANQAPSLPPSAWWVVAPASAFTAAFCVYQWPQWLNNPDLSHGLFAPVMFLWLLHEARSRTAWSGPRESAWLTAARGALLAGGVALVCLGGLYAAAIDWTHPLVSLSLALGLSALLLGALLWLSGERRRALPFNWTTLVAAGLWPLCVALPPGTYLKLTLQLQFWVTDIVLHSLHLLGVAASTSGNVILLAHTSVGVEEACSGVRSLLSCVVVAVFLSAALVLRPWARVVLIAVAPLLAFGMNIVRSLTLTLLANAGADIRGAWHDLTGFAVLGVTAAILVGLALWMERTGADRASAKATATKAKATAAEAKEAAAEAAKLADQRGARPWGILASYAITAALVVFFVLNTHGPAQKGAVAPDLASFLPVAPAGWDLVHTDDLYQFTSALETEHLFQRTYIRETDPARPGEPLQITAYIAYWTPGKVPVSLVASHTPEACWPGSGWAPQPVVAAPSPFTLGARVLSAPEYRAFTHDRQLQHVWYWHLYDGRSITQGDPRSAGALLRLAWNYGFRTAGEQFFVRISSNRPWEEIRDEPLLAEILARLQPSGL